MNPTNLKIKLTITDWFLEVLAGILLISTFVLIIVYYNNLPSQIASHYNAFGKRDGFSDKSMIWLLPIIMLVMYVTLSSNTRFPNTFNSLIKITDENVDRQHRNVVMMNRFLKAILVMVFFYITYATIQNGLGKMNGLGTLFLPVVLIIVLGTTGAFIYRGFKLG